MQVWDMETLTLKLNFCLKLASFMFTLYFHSSFPQSVIVCKIVCFIS